MLIKLAIFFLLNCPLIFSSKPTRTPFICIDSSNRTSSPLPSCLPGYVLEIDNVIYESTHDDSCSGITRCQLENKNTLLFACNRKRSCQVDLNNLHFRLNSTCGSTRRFFVQYHCLPVIQEQKDFLCDSPTARRPALGDINLSCIRNYRLHILNAWLGVSFRSAEDSSSRIKCTKDTSTSCRSPIANNYREICEYQSKQECKIAYHQRPELKDCPYGTASNFSLVEYLCIPDEGVGEMLPRIDVCSAEERLSADRGLLYSTAYTDKSSCEKELLLPRESRLRLYLLEKSEENPDDFQLELFKRTQTFTSNPYLDVNLANEKKPTRVRFLWKGGKFLLYFQIDSKLSEYAPFQFEPSGKTNGGRFELLGWKWLLGIIFACLLLLLLLVLLIYLIVRQRSKRAHRYTKNDRDDHRQPLSAPSERPYLASSSPAILPSSNRPQSAYSTTSSIILQQIHDGQSDRESLIKSPVPPTAGRGHGEIDNFYEEIKEQQQQTALALAQNSNQNLYLEARDVQDTKPLFQGQQGGAAAAQPIRDHHEVFYYECEK